MGEEVTLTLDAAGTLSIAVDGEERIRYASVPDDWVFAVSGGRLGTWEIVDEPTWGSKVVIPLDIAAHPQAFARHDYAAEEAGTSHLRSWPALMAKFDRVRVGRRKQIAAYAAREAQRAFAAYEADFLEKVRAEEEAEFGPGLEFGAGAAAGGGGAGTGTVDGATTEATVAAADGHTRPKSPSQPAARREPKGRISWLRSGTGKQGHESHVICVEQRPKN